MLERAARETRGGVLVMVEGVYGMTGELADLPGIVALKDHYGARLFVDDAHGVCSIGPGGRGTGAHLGVQDGIDIYFGTFAKSFAAIGGFAAAEEPVTEYIRYNARSQIFAKSLPMVVVAVLLKALDIIEAEPELLDRLWSNARKLQRGLRELGFELGNTRSAITPVYLPVGGVDAAMQIVRKMRDDKGVFISAVMYPVVPKGVVLCRLVPTASHTDDDIARTLAAFAEARDELGLAGAPTAIAAPEPAETADRP
jgi:glycine C-acetyltransferase